MSVNLIDAAIVARERHMPPVGGVSNQRNPAARHCTGMSAAAEGGMVTRIMRLYEGYGDLYIHGYQVVRLARSRNQGIRALTEKPPPTENTVFLQNLPTGASTFAIDR